jgi:asparagine synthase (glutamine-hydrolysing)
VIYTSMCGILALFGEEVDTPSYLLTHRGPDDYNTKTLGKCRMDFYRLSINDLTDAGMQPFVEKNHMLICNGEIYNHKKFRTGNEMSTSDCEVLLPLIKDIGILKTVNTINGDFAILYTDGKRILAARDPVGVRPLFYTRYAETSIAFASETKALRYLKSDIHIFPPGHIYDSYIDDFVCYHTGYWHVHKHIENPNVRNEMKETFENAVHERIATTDREIGFLLSGGLDSSLIASIATRKLGKIKTFSIGLEGSPDLKAARVVADYLKTDHTEVKFTVDEGISHLGDVIYTLESYDTTTVRASTPMWLLCKYIKENTECRYIFSGEGSDEVLGGYLYFHNAPGVNEFACENMRRLRLIHQFDGLRADRCAGAHGLDLIVPFLDKNFIDFCMNMNQNLKIDPMEKRLLREAFQGYLPDEILWRRKDGMSDAVGTNWVDEIKRYAEKDIDDTLLHLTKNRCRGHNIPISKEEALYRTIFWKFYGQDNDHLISEIWRPKWTKIKDPSARLLIEKNPK